MSTKAQPLSNFDSHFFNRFLVSFKNIDPRIPIAGVLFTYLVLGLTVLGFNRSPWQAVTTTISCCILEVILTWFFKRKWVFPLSAMITSFSLSFLLNYSHDFYLLFVPLFFAIGSKYIFMFKGKHALNPAMAGISLSLLAVPHLVTAAPAYQWNGIASMSVFIVMLGLLFVIPKVNRQWLVISFLFFFTVQTFLRALLMKHHLPFETLFLGTLSSPAFFIFTFFMITDPATSPPDRKQQIIVGFLLATLDLLYHLHQSYYTFFYAAFTVGMGRLLLNHFKQAKLTGLRKYFKVSFLESKYYLKPLVLLGLGLGSTFVYANVIHPQLPVKNLDWHFVLKNSDESGLNANSTNDLYELVDPRIQHIVKWVLSVGDSASVADVDLDGKPDLFLSNFLKPQNDRASLYLQTGPHSFTKHFIPELDFIRKDPRAFGVITKGLFADFDNDGDQDLFLTVGFGKSLLLKNLIKESGVLNFQNISEPAGVNHYSNSLGGTWADFNRDGKLDLLVLNVWPDNLPDYETPQPLNLFSLPAQESINDNRPFNFMHDSWHMSNNGGVNRLYLQNPDGTFALQDPTIWNIPETRWSLAVTAADLNQDGWTDLYIANDFGPDDLYFNKNGQKFINHKGTLFGSIGRDTYKGMNASAADFDQDGSLSVYVSNVHHAFQAEGSLFWKFELSPNQFLPKIQEQASVRGVLNEIRFGWGASATDFNNDGWVDIAQANGMVDDTIDKKFEECPDYWYVNEKIARSPPSIHRYANKWGDIQGSCIYGKEKNKLYLNWGIHSSPQFQDVADHVGLGRKTNSRAAISADFTNSGRRDLLITHQFEKPSLYVNEMKVVNSETTPQWIGFQLESLRPTCNREAIGSRLTLNVKNKDGKTWKISQEVQTVSGFSAQSDKRLHFGLGLNAEIISAEILWCGQSFSVLENLSPNRYHNVVLK